MEKQHILETCLHNIPGGAAKSQEGSWSSQEIAAIPQVTRWGEISYGKPCEEKGSSEARVSVYRYVCVCDMEAYLLPVLNLHERSLAQCKSVCTACNNLFRRQKSMLHVAFYLTHTQGRHFATDTTRGAPMTPQAHQAPWSRVSMLEPEGTRRWEAADLATPNIRS